MSKLSRWCAVREVVAVSECVLPTGVVCGTPALTCGLPLCVMPTVPDGTLGANECACAPDVRLVLKRRAKVECMVRVKDEEEHAAAAAGAAADEAAA